MGRELVERDKGAGGLDLENVNLECKNYFQRYICTYFQTSQ